MESLKKYFCKQKKMIKNRFNQAKHQSATANSPSTSKAREIFSKDNDIIDLKDTSKISIVHHHIDVKNSVNKELV